MKNFGLLLISLGFLGGALVSVLEVETLDWLPFTIALAIGVVGVALVRAAERRLVEAEGASGAGVQVVETSLDRLVEHIHRLSAEKESLGVYEVRHRIDELFPEDLLAFVDARESIGHVHGLQAYADVMSHFAAGERYLNRAWTASADGYIDEVHTYLDKCEAQFVEAQTQFRSLAA
jgi:hypothetical protein